MNEHPSLEVRIDLGDPTPPYAQVRAQLSTLIHTGALTHGDRLPTVRALAGDLGVAPGTIARAYGELEADGLVVGRRRFGTTVTYAGGDPGRSRLDAAARRFTESALADGHNPDDVLAAVGAALDDLASEAGPSPRR